MFESEADGSDSLFSTLLVRSSKWRDFVHWRKDCRNEKPVSSRALFQQNRYDPDLFVPAASFYAKWVVRAAVSGQMGFAVCPV